MQGWFLDFIQRKGVEGRKKEIRKREVIENLKAAQLGTLLYLFISKR